MNYNPSGSNYDYYPEGEELPDGGLTIIKLRFSARLMRDTLYLVRYDCCGAEVVLSHKQINERVRHMHTHCAACAQKKPKRKSGARPKSLGFQGMDYGCTPPEWPVPHSVLSRIRAHGWYAR